MIRTLMMSILLAASLSAQTDSSLTAPPPVVEIIDSAAATSMNETNAPVAGHQTTAWPAWILTFILLLACGVVLVYCRPRQALQVPIMSRIPEKIPPALVGYLLNKQVPFRAVLATLLDLASRRFLLLRADRSELILELDRSYWRKNAVHMEEFEDRVIRFVFGSRDKVSTKDFHDEVLAGFASRWKRKVRLAGEKRPWFDRKRMEVHLWFQIGAAVCFLASIGLVFLSGWWALLPTAVSAALFLISSRLSCYSEIGEIEFKQWTAFREYFQKRRFRKAEPQSLIDKIETYVLYLPVLDVDPEVFRELFLKVPGFSIRSALPWLILPEPPAQPTETLVNGLLLWLDRLSQMDSKSWIKQWLHSS